MLMVERDVSQELARLATEYPVVTVTGPRQSGKTTLVRTIFRDKPYFSLEDPDLRERVLADPRGFLKKLSDGAVFDEIQQLPELLSYIQGVVDSSGESGLFIITGSQQFELNAQITQSLAGRTALLKLLPLSIAETERFGIAFSVDQYILQGFYPGIYQKKIDPIRAYRNYFETYIQRDLRQLIQLKNLRLFQKFVRLCAGRIGSVFSASGLASDVGVSVPTIQSWISLLEASYVVFLLEPYYENIGKRLIKSPKLYFYDVGLAAYLLGIETEVQLERDRMRGPLVENLVLMELVKKRYNAGVDHNLYYYRDSHQNEVDLLYKLGNQLVPYEIKAAATYNKEFLKGLSYIAKLLPGRVTQGYLVYTGDDEQDIERYKLINYKGVAQTLL